MPAQLPDLLTCEDPDEVRDLLDHLVGGILRALTGDVKAAVEGEYGAINRYVKHSRLLTSKLVDFAEHQAADSEYVAKLMRTLSDERPGGRVRPGGPDLRATEFHEGEIRHLARSSRFEVLQSANAIHALPAAHAETPPSTSTIMYVIRDRAEAEVAPTCAAVLFTPWIGHFEPGEAAAIHMLSHLRAAWGWRPLHAPAEWAAQALQTCPVDDAARFQSRAMSVLAGNFELDPLLRIADVFGLSKAEIGGLFGVTRQAVDHWLATGVPSSRQEKLATILSLADLLERKLKPERIPGVARRPAAAYSGRTMLEMIAADEHRELLGLARESFDWAAAA